MFVKSDLKEVGLSAFNYMPYAVGLVSLGGEPASVSEALIFALRRRLREIAEACVLVGDKVSKPDNRICY